MSEFTKGPWTFDEYQNLNAGDELLMVSGVRIPCGHSHDEVKANMSLIAAAPDMLEALEAITAMVDRQPDFNDDGDGLTLSRCYEAIAKAKGESK